MYKVYSHDIMVGRNYSVCWNGKNIYERGTIELSPMGEGIWWVARAIVQPEEKRGQGIGNKMFRLLKEELMNIEKGFIKLIVAPGGYNVDYKRQKQFYIKNGFVKISDRFELILRS